MAVHILAIALWVGSLALYGAAFFFPEVHRRHDFFWSGVAAFYGLVLWFDAAQISSTELLGHGASLALLGWFGWQTLSLRRKRTPLDLQTPLTAESWPTFWNNLRRSLLGLAQATPLGRWLPETWEQPKAAAPIAVSELRASSLKEVDYEFVDELDSVMPVPPRARPTFLAEKPAEPASPQISPRPPAVAKPKGPGLGVRVAGLRAWVGDLVKAKTSPPPKREVIDIPPRPSPLNRKKSQREMIDIPPRPSPLDRKKSQREMIDIPPRPSPLDRNKPKPPEDDSTPAETVTIVDAAAVASDLAAPPIAPDSAPESDVPSGGNSAASTGADATDRPTHPADSGLETNWDDEDTNWIDD
ncbi:Ycf66 family protein [Nodosilinea sp. PGN35]|uniref:Ycf66 family protein n=1 Tax=Nodosilinea sp. PGN35 TaxID=3020489 RepID=UPI0023B23132|nr:Ycf66 family protein [Nodosilinea sp. TSF1-S3]MDF0368010.1 Ycf66 family protein [Nodosilinea sp. TSF1-S3]